MDCDVVKMKAALEGLDGVISNHIQSEMDGGRCGREEFSGWANALMVHLAALVSTYCVEDDHEIPNSEKERVMRELREMVVEKIASESKPV